MPGSTLPALGKLIELKGFGKRFNGNAFISSVHHSMKEGTWITTVGFGLNDQWFVEREKVNSMKASGLLPGINGLQIGTVKKIDSDVSNITIPRNIHVIDNDLKLKNSSIS